MCVVKCILVAGAAIFSLGIDVKGQDFYFPSDSPVQLSLSPTAQQTISKADTAIDTNALKLISKGIEEFSLQLFRSLSTAVAEKTSTYDFIISPASIWTLLALQAEGAAGNTLEQLKTVLRLPNDLQHLRAAYQHIQNALLINTGAVEVAVAQAAFSHEAFPTEPEYVNKLSSIYKADHISLNFLDLNNAYNTIKKYVSDKTRGEIADAVINEDDLRDAQMILISAIFFKGQWKFPFNASHTANEPFFDENGRVINTVHMMFQSGAFAYTAIKEIDSYILELPYGAENRLSMILILPRKGAILSTVLDKLALYGISNIITELRHAEAEFDDDGIEVLIPRFSITAEFNLNPVLKQMGLMDIFDSNRADLSNLSKQPIYLSQFLQKSVIKVDEVGTVATAASAAVFTYTALPPRFHANRPFAFLIVERISNTLLFCGQVRNPGKVQYSDF